MSIIVIRVNLSLFQAIYVCIYIVITFNRIMSVRIIYDQKSSKHQFPVKSINENDHGINPALVSCIVFF